VVSAACDALPIPDLTRLVGDVPAAIDGHWLFGFWPVRLVDALEVHLLGEADRSVRGWIAACNARLVKPDAELHNLNTKADIVVYEGTLEQHA
jgi:molybdenum cofactor guanylyltransferase